MLAPLFVIACKSGDTGGVDTDVADNDVATALVEGVYDGTIIGYENNTCGDLRNVLVFSTGSPTVSFQSATTFTIDYGSNIQEACTLSGTTVACDGYALVIPVDDATQLPLESTIAEVEITSTTTFEQTESLVLDCNGGGCADFSTRANATFPCTLDVVESFVHPSVEGLCEDGLDNDGDGSIDQDDDDCPDLIPRFWGVSGEFGYDAAADAVVPFVVEGVERAPTVVIHLASLAYSQTDDEQQMCTIALTYTGAAGLPLAHEEWTIDADVFSYDGFVMPADTYTIETDCDEKDMDIRPFGTVEEIAAGVTGAQGASGWGIYVGTIEASFTPGGRGLLDDSAYAGGAARNDYYDDVFNANWSLPIAVDADMNVLNAAGDPASASEMAAETGLMRVDPTLVTDAGALPSGAYIVTSYGVTAFY